MKKIFSMMCTFLSLNISLAQSWIKLNTPRFANAPILSICTDKSGNLYAAGTFTDSASELKGDCFVAKWNGTLWSELGIGGGALNANGQINSICADTTGNLYVAGAFTSGATDTNGYHYVAVYNPASAAWSELGAGSHPLHANNVIYSICTDVDGNVYAAGDFKDSTGYWYVAVYNRSTGDWSELGAGTHPLHANNTIYTICTDLSNNVYAAGDFTDTNFLGGTIDNNLYRYVAKYTAAIGDWDSLGSGCLNFIEGPDPGSYNIYTLCADTKGNIFAAGDFGDTLHAYVAKWDGTSWSKLIDGDTILDGDIFSLCTDAAGNIYAGGGFINSEENSYVAEYSITTGLWGELGGYNSLRANGGALSVCMDAIGNIYAGGGFNDGHFATDTGKYFVVEYTHANTGVSVVNKNDDVNIYPNPTNNILNIKQSGMISAEYFLYDITGRLELSGVLKNGNTSVDVGGLASGVYLLRVGEKVCKVVKE